MAHVAVRPEAVTTRRLHGARDTRRRLTEAPIIMRVIEPVQPRLRKDTSREAGHYPGARQQAFSWVCQPEVAPLGAVVLA
jgi:hypothetical protein